MLPAWATEVAGVRLVRHDFSTHAIAIQHPAVVGREHEIRVSTGADLDNGKRQDGPEGKASQEHGHDSHECVIVARGTEARR